MKTLVSKIPNAGLKFLSPFGPKAKGGKQIKGTTKGASNRGG